MKIHTIPVKKTKNSKMKRDIKYYVDENDCWICTSHKKSHGYPRIRRNNKGMTISRYMYQRVKGKIPKGKIVRHKCDNPACINPDHLELGTMKDNSQDMVKRGRSTYGEKNGQAKLTVQDVIEIKSSAETQRALAAKYNVSHGHISDIKNGKCWAHIKTKVSNKNHLHKLTESDVVVIKNSDEPYDVLANRYGVSRSNINAVRSGQSWKSVKGSIKRTSRLKLTEKEAKEIKYSSASIDYLAKKFGVSKATIYDVQKGKSWRNL